MTSAQPSRKRVNDSRFALWAFLYGILILYVMWRMQGFAIWIQVPTAQGLQVLPNTFASVDHPFHVARAGTLWQELSSGHILRWIGQHQGGYPAEFYPLGEAWLEVIIRASSLKFLPPEGAHTFAVIALFLLPGAAFAALARQDGYPPSVGLLALALQIGLPGGWYGGGYTELVQWGLVTNVAGATATILTLPALLAATISHSRRALALASGLAAVALYCNPRSAIGLAAVGIGVVVAAMLARRQLSAGVTIGRPFLVAALSGLLAAPLLMSLLRFDDLYAFVHYSGYVGFEDYLAASLSSLSFIGLVLGVAGALVGLVQRAVGTRAAAASLIAYALATSFIAFAPGVAPHVQQLEPTRLMPLQRYLLLYLAAALTWRLLSGVFSRSGAIGAQGGSALVLGTSIAVVAICTRPMFVEPPDPASPVVPAVSLYPVAMSAQPQQADLESAIRAADEAADPSTAILVIGSALSWHQQLWAPLWTQRPLYYDNWLWFWHLDHAGTPGYRAQSGHHYPDPELALTREYLDRHGIGAVVASQQFRARAAEMTYLTRISGGAYETFIVDDPTPLVTFGSGETSSVQVENSSIEARSTRDSQKAEVRLNWFPRWETQSRSGDVVGRKIDGTIHVAMNNAASDLSLDYSVQPLDWVARVLATIGVLIVLWLSGPGTWPGRLLQKKHVQPRGDA